jgi:hypothetical protein
VKYFPHNDISFGLGNKEGYFLFMENFVFKEFDNWTGQASGVVEKDTVKVEADAEGFFHTLGHRL